MAGNWNPNSDDTQGLEWLAHTEGATLLDSGLSIAGQTNPSTVAETIDNIDAFLDVASPGRWLIEVYLEGNEICDDPITFECFEASGDATITDVQDEGGAVINLFQSIDEDCLVCDISDYITTDTTPIAQATYGADFGSGGFVDGRRVLQARLSYCCKFSATANKSFTLRVDMVETGSGDVIEAVDQVVIAGGTTVTRDVNLFENNPFTGLPWTPADIRAFSTGGIEVQFQFLNVPLITGPDAPAGVKLARASLEVDWELENRVAYAAADVAATGWQTFGPVQEPDGTANWPKALGPPGYTFTMRRVRQEATSPLQIGLPGQTGAASWRSLDADPFFPPPGIVSHPLISGTVVPAQAVTANTAYTASCPSGLGANDTRGYAVVPHVLAGTDSDDSQAYASGPAVLTVIGSTLAGNPVEQEITTVGAKTYGVVRLLLQPPSADFDPPGVPDLELRIRRRSDNLQFGSTEVITSAEVSALPIVGPAFSRRFERAFATPPALAAATQYFVELTSVPDSTNPFEAWGIVPLNTIAFAGHSSSNFNGAVDDFEGQASQDLPVVLIAAPAPPANLACVVMNQARPTDGTSCAAEAIEFIRVTWDATVLGGLFLGYELQRSDDGGTTFQTVSRKTVESDTTFDDYESRRGVEACYRVRVQRTDFAFSDFSAESCCTASAKDCELVLTSNEDPSLNLAYNDQTPRTYTFLNAAGKVLTQVFGRDFQVAATPFEDRGDQFTFDLILFAASDPSSLPPPQGEGRVVFDALEAIQQAQVSYICVLESDGRRWFAAIQVTQGTRREPGKLYVGTVIVTEIVDVPSAPT